MTIEENKNLLYKKLHCLRLEVDGSIVDDIKKTVDDLFSTTEAGEDKEKAVAFAQWLEEGDFCLVNMDEDGHAEGLNTDELYDYWLANIYKK